MIKISHQGYKQVPLKLMLVIPFVPYFTFGEDYLMVNELGQDVLMLGAVAIIVMLWAPKGLWGLVVERFGFVVFPLERRVVIEDRGK